MRNFRELIADKPNSGIVEVIEMNFESSIMELQNEVLADHGFDFNELETLKMYLDHDWVEDNASVLLNDSKLMSVPLIDLLDNYYIYELVAELNA